jgi:hypothetical protein
LSSKITALNNSINEYESRINITNDYIFLDSFFGLIPGVPPFIGNYLNRLKVRIFNNQRSINSIQEEFNRKCLANVSGCSLIANLNDTNSRLLKRICYLELNGFTGLNQSATMKYCRDNNMYLFAPTSAALRTAFFNYLSQFFGVGSSLWVNGQLSTDGNWVFFLENVVPSRINFGTDGVCLRAENLAGTFEFKGTSCSTNSYGFCEL